MHIVFITIIYITHRDWNMLESYFNINNSNKHNVHLVGCLKLLTYTTTYIPVGARFFAHVHTGPGAHPASCTMGTGSFPGVKRPGHGTDHPPPPSAEVENESSYTATPHLGPSWPFIGWPLPFTTTYIYFFIQFLWPATCCVSQWTLIIMDGTEVVVLGQKTF
jgi:hypothetical protein